MSQIQVDLLSKALRNVLIKDGVVSPNAQPNGPELILAAEEYCKCNHDPKDICDCACHKSPMMHIRACCHKCDHCDVNIKE